MGESTSIVYIVDDDPAVRSAIESLLRSVGILARSFASAREFLDTVPVAVPACLVLDVRLPGTSGLELQSELAIRDPALPIIFISGHGDIPMSVRAIKAGAVEFLPKPFREQDLLDAIQVCLERHRVALRAHHEGAELRARFESLTPRERQVMELVVEGRLNKEIGEQLGIREVTVKIHRRQVMQKMRARSVAELVRIGERVR